MAANTYVALDKVTVSGSSTTTIQFLNISQAYTDLHIVINYGSTTAGNYQSRTYNADSSSLYSYTQLYGNGTNAYSGRASNTTVIYDVVNTLPTTLASMVTIDVLNYSNTTTYKTSITRDSNSASTAAAIVGLYRSTNAITRIDFGLTGGAFLAGSTFSLYGIKADTNSTSKASGGFISSDATYWYHTFATSGTFSPNQTLSCDYLIVAGGGGGGTNGGGGGGAGGYRTFTGQSITSGNYSVTIGAGGAGSSNGTLRGSSGADSIFNSATSSGGGGGASRDQSSAGIAGGSGGGGANASGGGTALAGGAGNTPSTSPSQGNSGGSTPSDGGINGAGSGGGGAGGAGSAPTNHNTSSVVGGAGGIGSNSLSSWSTATNTGINGYYAGGGGGGLTVNGTGGTGGAGGGGNASIEGIVNTGGGGGGGGISGSANGKAGGSGLVIIRYAK